MKVFVLKEKGKQLVTGVSVGNGIGAGRAHIIKDKKHMHDFKSTDLLSVDFYTNISISRWRGVGDFND
jgi:phosphoenolpyruvate synthase/pyruvate phosphate dikinase